VNGMVSNAFKASFRISWADTDAAQVVHFSNYFRFFEKTEEEFYRHLGFTFIDAHKRGLWFPRVEAFCQFKKPARFNDLVEVELTIEELKEKSVKYSFRVLNGETSELLANGYMILVAADKQTGKAAKIPMVIVEKLKSYIE
jgi:acyl-CoA thioester hydrolase